MSVACLASTTVVDDDATPALRGDLAVWIFILAELLAFGVFFIAYAFTRSRHAALFNEFQATLDRDAGALNTLLLISASALVVKAIGAVRTDDARRGARLLLAAIACGGGFVGVKSYEFAAKFGAGIDLSTNTFYMFYLALTGFHFFHVVLGMAVLAIVWWQTRRGRYGRHDSHDLESAAAYWHMVDLVWLILFPLVYVMR
jgi:nitric oxide reductase NorE protein